MKKQLDLQDVERRVQRSFYQDGVIELIGGFYFLVMGLIVNDKLSAAFIPLFIIFLKPLMQAAKKHLIYPRIGYVKFRETNTSDGKALPWIVIGLAILAVASPFISILILGKEPGWVFWTRRFLPLFTSLIIAIGPYVGAKLLNIKRWFIFSILCIAVGIGVHFLGLESIYDPIAVELMIIGGVALLTGLVMVISFVIRNPIVNETEVSIHGSE